MRRLLACGLLLTLAGCGTAHPSSTPSISGPSASPPATGQGPGTFVPRTARATTLGWRLPTPVAREVIAASSGSSLLMAGGMLADDTSTDQAYRLDLSTGHSTGAAHLGVPVHDAAGGSYAGQPAVFGGGNSSEQSIVQQLRGGRWRVVDHLPTTRSDLSVAEVGGATYVLGGYDGVGVPRSVLLQRGTTRLAAAGSLRVGVRYAATAVVGTSVYLFGGEVAGQELSTVQRYDTTTGRTRVVARLPRALGHAMAVYVGGRVLLLGGRITPDLQTDRMWWFDPASHRFSPAGRLPRPVSDAAVTVVGTSVYLLGGEDPSVTDRVVRIALS